MTEKKKAAVIKPEIATIAVAPGDEPWTEAEIAELRSELVATVDRMRKKIAEVEENLAEMLSEGPDGAGKDPAVVGSSNFERDQGMSLAANSREVLEQARLALKLLDEGHYGLCDVCGKPIGKLRLQAFPRATTCVTCKQAQERR